MTLAAYTLSALVALSGARGNTKDAANVTTKKLPDYSGCTIPKQLAGGILSGKPFVHDFSKIKCVGWNKVSSPDGKKVDKTRSYILTLQVGKDPLAPKRLLIFLTADEPTLELKTFKIRPYPFGSAKAREQTFTYKGKKRLVGMGLGMIQFTMTEGARPGMFSDNISGRVEFFKKKNGKIPGQLILVMPDNSYVTGLFYAQAG